MQANAPTIPLARFKQPIVFQTICRSQFTINPLWRLESKSEDMYRMTQSTDPTSLHTGIQSAPEQLTTVATIDDKTEF